MPSKADLENALKDAMRAVTTSASARCAWSSPSLKLAEVEKRGLVDEAGIVGILRKEIKMRQEAIEEAGRASRPDLVEASQAELAAAGVLPPQGPRTRRTRTLVRQAITESGAAGPQDMGKVMKVLVPLVEGRADGKLVSVPRARPAGRR